MQLICYPLLGTNSKKALLRAEKRGWAYKPYAPQGNLLQRLSKQLGWSIDRVAEQLHKEREYLYSRDRQ
jgi:hypothetical protein